jgi:hypothetical protein
MEIICLQAKGWSGSEKWNDGYLICPECGTPIHHSELTGIGTHEVGCPFCGTYLGCDD